MTTEPSPATEAGLPGLVTEGRARYGVLSGNTVQEVGCGGYLVPVAVRLLG